MYIVCVLLDMVASSTVADGRGIKHEHTRHGYGHVCF